MEGAMIEEDAAFYRLLREKDPAALQKMVETHADRLLRGAFFLCRNEPEAQDLVHDTLYQAFRSLQNFNGDSSVYCWLYGILRNVFLNRNRRDRRFSTVLSDGRATWLNPNAVALGAENMESNGLDDLIGGLPPKHREIIHLRYGEGLKIREISEILGVSNGTVKSRLFHATRKLKKCLLRNPGAGPGPEKEKSYDV
jgi:RNA polymerase sigma-70 factor (ECF subfamily)